LPFTETGSSHDFHGGLLTPNILPNYVESTRTDRYARCHPGTFKGLFEKTNSNQVIHNNLYRDTMKLELSYLSDNFKKILILYPTQDTRLWYENNQLQKVLISESDYQLYFEPAGLSRDYMRAAMTKDPLSRFKIMLEQELDSKNISQWGKQNISDFDEWELRELLSMYWFNRDKDLYTCCPELKTSFPEIKFISIDNFKNNFQKTVIDYLNYFEVDIDQDKLSQLDFVKQEWNAVQHHINTDSLVKKIINSIISQQEFEWEPLTILDEAYLQKCLADAGIQIKCYELNKFPTNTKDFLPLLEYTA